MTRSQSRLTPQTNGPSPRCRMQSLKPADSYRKLDSRPKGASNDHVADWLARYKSKPEFKGKYQQLLKYVNTVRELFKSGTAKHEVVEASTRFGLDSKLSIKNLSTAIAVAQLKTA